MVVKLQNPINIRNLPIALYIAYLPCRGIMAALGQNDSMVRLLTIFIIVLIQAYSSIKTGSRLYNATLLLGVLIVVVYLETILIYPQNTTFIIKYIPEIIYALIALFFFGRRLDYDDLIEGVRIGSIILFIYWQITIAFGNMILEDGGEYSMTFGISLSLPTVVFLYDYFYKKRAVAIIFAIISAFEILLFGNKSPLVIIAVYILITFYTKSEKKILRRICIVLACALLVLLSNTITENIVHFLEKIGISSRSLRHMEAGRFFSLIQGTGGRNVIYQTSFEAIKKSPIIGYGIKGDMALLGTYPHNFILELTIQFGIPLTIFILFFLFTKIRRSIITDKEISNFLLMICIYAFTYLFVSGSFWALKEFWIVVSIIIVSSKKTKSKEG